MTTFKPNTLTESLSTSRRKPTTSTSMISSQRNSRQIFRLFPCPLSPTRAMRTLTYHRSSFLEITIGTRSTWNLWTMASETPKSQKKTARRPCLLKKKNTFHKYRQLNYSWRRDQRRLRMLTMKQRTFLRTTSKLSLLSFWKILTTLKNFS